MKAFRKILALLLLSALIVSTLTACKKNKSDAEGGLAECDKHLRSHSARVDISIDFTCDDEISGVFEELKKNTTTVYIDGEKLRSVNDQQIETSGDVYRFTTEYTSVNGILYRKTSYSLNGVIKNESREFSPITSEEKKTLGNKVCYVGGLSEDDFSTVTQTQDGERLTFSFSGAKSSARVIMEEMMIELFADTAELVDATEVTLTVNTVNGAYESAVASCDYTVTIGGKAYTVRIDVRLAFTFDSGFAVSAPGDYLEYIKSEESLLP